MKRILWFRRDLRVEDNPLLSFGEEVLPIFIFDENILKELTPEDKRVSFIFLHVAKLKYDLKKKGLDLKVFYGKPEDVFGHIRGFDEVVASGDYDAYARDRDIKISRLIHFRYLYDTYIFNPKEILKSDGSPYLVFTPFYKRARELLISKNIDEAKAADNILSSGDYEGITAIDERGVTKLPFCTESIGFRPLHVETLCPYEKLEIFKQKISDYEKTRDFLDADITSRLGIDLRFGTISIRAVLREFIPLRTASEAFVRQLVFRDFYAYLLFHMPRLESRNYRYSFNGIADEEKFRAFCESRTGVPIVDAAVRELVTTGNMHNRARMIAASFFTKDLLLPWQWGERFFAEHLLDYDAASNVLSWQWSAGTGVDPQPYFRVFNPYTQAKKFDKEALYIKRWLPQLQDVDAKYINDEEYLLKTSFENYPKPMVVHKEATRIAVEHFRARHMPCCLS